MFFRTKKAGLRSYLRIVENHRVGRRTQQRVIATLGRLEELQSSGQLDGLLCSGVRFAEAVMLLGAHQNGQLPAVSTRRIGAALIFERLWRETGCQAAIAALLRGRHYEFLVERAVFLTVLNRLVAPGSDRAAERWRRDYAIEGVEGLELHHLYRAMGWLGEPRPESEQEVATPFAPRKDPAPLKVKEVAVEGRRYVVCLNEDQRRKEAADREAIVDALREQLPPGDKSLVGNKGYRKYLKTQGQRFRDR